MAVVSVSVLDVTLTGMGRGESEVSYTHLRVPGNVLLHGGDDGGRGGLCATGVGGEAF